MNNRLDFITTFTPGATEQMTAIRAKFMALDDELREMATDVKDPATVRAISIARTHIETSLQYAIKGLCLKHEKKEG